MRTLTVDQVGDALQVSRWKVHELIRTGQLKSLKLGRARRITEKALEDFITELEAA